MFIFLGLKRAAKPVQPHMGFLFNVHTCCESISSSACVGANIFFGGGGRVLHGSVSGKYDTP